MSPLARFARLVLAVNLAVVVWGAFVRASGSGAGCGKHWPTCNGEVVPHAPAVQTMIEFTHRATSGLALVLVVALAAWALRALPRGHAARKAAWAAVAFMISEALVGAGLVLFGWVAKDASAARGWVMAVHLTNTFLLLAALALAAEWTTPGVGAPGRRSPPAGLTLALAAAVVAGLTGAIAALGDSLFPAMSFAAGLRAELGGQSALLLRLRVLHPFAAIGAGVLSVLAARTVLRETLDARAQRAALAVHALVGAELAAGTLNVLLLAPTWLQLVHLLVADLLWIALVVLAARTAAGTRAAVAAGAGRTAVA